MIGAAFLPLYTVKTSVGDNYTKNSNETSAPLLLVTLSKPNKKTMFHKLERSSANVIGFKATGKLTDEDYKTKLIPEIDNCIRENGNIRLLWQMEDFHGWELKAAWDDFEYGVKINDSVDFIALVGENEWEKAMSGLIKPFAKGQVRYFNNNEIDEAWYWLRTAGGEESHRGAA